MFETDEAPGGAARLHWRYRAATLLLGAILAAAGISYLHSVRVDGDEATLMAGQRSWATSFEGRVIAARRLEDYPSTYVPGDDPRPEGLWLGNSQLHTINEYQPGDETAPHHASEALGWPVWCLSLPLVNMREEYVILHFALSRRNPDLVVLQLTFNTFRFGAMRQELQSIADEPTRASLATTGLGRELLGQLDAMGGAATISDAKVDFDTTSQQRAERALDHLLASSWPLWAHRGDILTALRIRLYMLRNWVFGISSSTKRPTIPAAYQRNMAALDAFLEFTESRGIPVLVYICPLRQEVELPYIMSEYEAWKAEAAAMCEAHGAVYRDLDTLVSSVTLWGRHVTGEVDFMHFAEGGHRLVGHEIAELIRDHIEIEER